MLYTTVRLLSSRPARPPWTGARRQGIAFAQIAAGALESLDDTGTVTQTTTTTLCWDNALN